MSKKTILAAVAIAVAAGSLAFSAGAASAKEPVYKPIWEIFSPFPYLMPAPAPMMKVHHRHHHHHHHKVMKMEAPKK